MNIFEEQQQEFIGRHIGPSIEETSEMLSAIGVDSMEELIEKTVPASIRLPKDMKVCQPMSEAAYLKYIDQIGKMNNIFRSYIGCGYYSTFVPSVIARNVFENPGWYTQYTPYQAEIAQGRLESLLNYQTMVSDLCGLPVANASLLDEGTAAAEAMTMLFNHKNKNTDHISSPKFFVDKHIHRQTLDILITRAKPVGIELVVGDFRSVSFTNDFFGIFIQYPNSEGAIIDYRECIEAAHAAGSYVVMATDLLALTMLVPPGELGADVAVGNSQRFGVPKGFGGPHAAFFATKDEFKRNIPGRIIGVSVDADGNRCLRMALQTREQHIRREKATSNICTAQALLANMAAMFAVYHGPKGLKKIAERVTTLTTMLATKLEEIGFTLVSKSFFDTIKVKVNDANKIKQLAEAKEINFNILDAAVEISLDETTTLQDVQDIVNIFTASLQMAEPREVYAVKEQSINSIPKEFLRTSIYLTHSVFNTHHSESQMMRYIKSLENKDLSLNTSMISLGSCTMKLNAATELIPVSWPAFNSIHPFAPKEQTKGYQFILNELSTYLNEITGFAATSLQPNSGAQGEYTGLLTMKAYHLHHKNTQRDIILIPISAHGTNPASAVMAGFKVVVTKCDAKGNIDFEDLKLNVDKYKDTLAGLMVTYPSTHGVFEEGIKEICTLIHDNGGLVYMDGANMNAQVGLTSPGYIGADVCHLNLHKTFAIPHGGGGPGMGPICVNEKLAPFLPSHFTEQKTETSIYPVSAAMYGSASILLISYAYIKMLGGKGLTDSTKYAILNANYMKAMLEKDFSILYSGANGYCAHEFIVDLRPFKASAGIEAEDVAKRLMDYNFHAPTMSFPVTGTIMIEPTESEDKAELDRFCNALLQIREEIRAIENGTSNKENNLLKNAPHTLRMLTSEEWTYSYSRQDAAFPLPYVQHNKFWPSVRRVNNTFGDRNLICTCEPTSAYAE